jgi:hypothetical protein
VKEMMSVAESFFEGSDSKTGLVSLINDVQLQEKLISQNICDQMMIPLQTCGFCLLVIGK